VKIDQTRAVSVGGVTVGSGNRLALIAGPCVIESKEACLETARRLCDLAEKMEAPLIFKASYDKANRTSGESFRGPGIDGGLDILRKVKKEFNLPILTDVHSVEEVARASEVADMLQLPAFLCRQTDLAVALGKSGKAVNIKKGQFLSPWDVGHVVDKVAGTGNGSIMITERGTSFGYHNLVADMRSLPVMRKLGYPVVFDATHSVQLPGGEDGRSGGDRWLVEYLARAAVATGVDAVFLEVHTSPEHARCDKDNAFPVDALPELWKILQAIDCTIGR
jgi:2-dehydro-3-deoxyphosphooctonate aldolase (KDO 8-P synthase)